MISVIIPVYNVEPYLRKCLDSVVNQTYKDLEILIIDDGSTDGSGAICDEYGNIDSRIRVFHTENKGLSCARNLGLDEAQGEWIGFVDSDDWIEPDMYEVLIDRAQETGADVVECGVFWEYPEKTVEHVRNELSMSGMDAVKKLLHRELYNAVWNKLWKFQCFAHIRFPAGRICEDIATTYLVFLTVTCGSTSPTSKYHYLRRDNSLSMKYDMANLVGYWLSNKERYDYLRDQVDEIDERELRKQCSLAVVRTWAHYYDCTTEERNSYHGTVREMNAFVRQNIPLFGYKKWGLMMRIGVFLAHFQNAFIFRMAWSLNRSMKTVSGFVRAENSLFVRMRKNETGTACM